MPSLTYTQAVADCRSQYLASVFQKASEDQIALLHNTASFHKMLKREAIKRLFITICNSICFLFILADLVGAALLVKECACIVLGIAICFAIIAAILISSSAGVRCEETTYDTIKKATAVFISPYGANTDTISCISKCPQNIEYEIFRPYFCKDDKGFETVTLDKHDVFVVYSDKTKLAVIVDPMLFE